MPPPSHLRQDTHPFRPINPRSPQNVSDPESSREMRESRPRWSTSDVKKRSRSNSTPPGSTRFIHVQVQGQGLITVGGSPATQFVAQLDPRPRRNSVSHPPAPTPGRMFVSSLADRPVIPGVTTNVAHVPNRLRKDPYQRPRIFFYHKHEPHYGFTNFSDHPVIHQGRTYPTSEHLFQSFKVCGTLSRAFAMII